MKNLITRVLIVATISTAAFKANAQKDYIITVKGDTIPCTISTSLSGKERYKINGEATRIKPGAIREYYIAHKSLRERSVYPDGNTLPVFMIVVEEGPITLYKTVPYNNKSATEWYIGKGSDRVDGLKTSGLYLARSREQRKDILATMLKDNPGVYEKYRGDDKFTFKQIRNLVHLYNTGRPMSD